jgi:hypothetical protein
MTIPPPGTVSQFRALRYSSLMLAPTPHDKLVDPQGRPYFL